MLESATALPAARAVGSERVLRQPSWTVPAKWQHRVLLQSGRVWLLFASSVIPLLLLEANRLRQAAQRGPALADSFPVLLIGFQAFLFIAPAWALLTWRGEAWDQRHHHWSLPVSHFMHDMWRIIAGGVWLIAGAALFCGTGLGLALRAGQTEVLTYGPVFWLNFLTYPLALYLMASIAPLATRRPIEWTVGIVAGGAGLVFLAQVFGIGPISGLFDAILDGRFGLHTAMDAGFVAESIQFGSDVPIRVAGYTSTLGEWLTATALWLGIPLVGVIAAARRHR